jgi:hypothetical protein
MIRPRVRKHSESVTSSHTPCVPVVVVVRSTTKRRHVLNVVTLQPNFASSTGVRREREGRRLELEECNT